MSSRSKILVLGGPTAGGKSRIALDLACRYPAEIVNADSRQIYRYLIIGTDQPSVEQQSPVPHHLYGFLDPEMAFTAADYEKAAVLLVEQITSRRNLPILVGGTGFYLKALLKGTWPVPPKSEELRHRLKEIEKEKGREHLHRILRRIDPVSAGEIDVNDVYRVIRSLEIFFQSGQRRSQLKQSGKDRFEAIKFYITGDRSKLKENIVVRTEQMFARGWVEEVRRLLERFPGFENMPAASSLGYPEIIRHLRGKMDLEPCKQEIIRKITQYAKRQLTWFRNQDQFTPVQSVEDIYKILESVLELD